MRTRTVKVGDEKYMHCDVMATDGPRGGRTVCGPVKKRKHNNPKPKKSTGGY